MTERSWQKAFYVSLCASALSAYDGRRIMWGLMPMLTFMGLLAIGVGMVRKIKTDELI
jgi:hypothetical protein